MIVVGGARPPIVSPLRLLWLLGCGGVWGKRVAVAGSTMVVIRRIAPASAPRIFGMKSAPSGWSGGIPAVTFNPSPVHHRLSHRTVDIPLDDFLKFLIDRLCINKISHSAELFVCASM